MDLGQKNTKAFDSFIVPNCVWYNLCVTVSAFHPKIFQIIKPLHSPKETG